MLLSIFTVFFVLFFKKNAFFILKGDLNNYIYQNNYEGYDNRQNNSTLSPYQLKMLEEEENAKNKRNIIKLEYLKTLKSTNLSEANKLRIIKKNIEEISYVYDIKKGIHFEDF